MSWEIARTALEEAIRLSGKVSQEDRKPDLTVILHGGEPALVFPLVQQIVDAGTEIASRSGKSVMFAGQTNLNCLTQEMIDYLQRKHVSWGISLDGLPELNDRCRVLPNGEGTYRYFAKALQQFPEFVRASGVLTTITAYNQDHLLAIARHLRDLQMRAWGWSIFQALGMGRGQEDQYEVSYPRLIEAWNELFEAVERGEFNGFDVGPVTRYLEGLICGPGRYMCMRNGCGAARELLSVSADGVIECCDCIDRRSEYGNLGRVKAGSPDSLVRAWRSSKAEAVRSRNARLGECDGCIWLAICGAHCLGYTRSLTGRAPGLCVVAANAFTRIAQSIARSSSLHEYWKSLHRGGSEGKTDEALLA